MSQSPVTHFLSNYTSPAYLITATDLQFDLHESHTEVTASLALERSPQSRPGEPLRLDGEQLELISLHLDGELLQPNVDFHLDAAGMTIARVGDHFRLTVVTRIYPDRNTELQGLYRSSGLYCTQCEAEGFRRITYYLDRPDVMSRFSTRITAERQRCPVLLSNGNLVAEGEDGSGRHWVQWQDPYPKPSYLFALVAGDLCAIEDRFITQSGREVSLSVYVEAHNIDKCAHAMSSLQRAMAWDEQVYGCEYDLDRYMIVAVDDFNMGAMENKGLNIFNSKYVLASPETATDNDYLGIESVVAHEYFHNWSGNRVTCRDWFQLSLKEGFTVFRDQQFSADMNSYGVQRIDDVNILRTHQFREDAGPLAHPVRPASYVEINNFYTVTVYNKGAEVIRMLYQLLGPRGFRHGTDLYFARHDGCAVTTDDFVRAMEDANGIDLTQFKRWYEQAGTPEVAVTRHYDAQTQRYTLELRQSCPATPGQTEKLPFHLPVKVGLLDAQGYPMLVQLHDMHGQPASTSVVLELTEACQRYEFINVTSEPIPSLLRDFSAPVKIRIDLTDEERCLLLAHDEDEFNRWDAGQQLAVKLLLSMIDDLQQGRPPAIYPGFVEAMGRVLSDESLDPALAALILELPSEAYLSEFQSVIDPITTHKARVLLRQHLAQDLASQWWHGYQRHTDDGAYELTSQAMGRRRLRNQCLGYLAELGGEALGACQSQVAQANNMTDVIAALSLLAQHECPQRDEALAAFYQRWQHESLVMDKWLAIQATSRHVDTPACVRALMQHPVFKLSNPNKVRALVGSFCAGNPAHFHAMDGSGYQLLGSVVRTLNDLNPQIAARLLSPLVQWRRYDGARQALMLAELHALQSMPSISRDVYEVISKSLSE